MAMQVSKQCEEASNNGPHKHERIIDRAGSISSDFIAILLCSIAVNEIAGLQALDLVIC